MTPATETFAFSVRMERIHELAERIRILYNPPREYFTIGIPVFVAILLVVGAFFAGYTFMGTEKAVQGDSDKLKAYQELMAQMNAEDGSSAVTESPKADTAKEKPKMGLDEIFVFAVLIAIAPYAIDITLQKRNTRRKEELYTEFLFKLSELMRGGLDPIKSVKELSKTDLGILTPHVRIASTAMLYGKSFEESMKSMAKSLHSELVTRYTTLVVQASYSGGVGLRSHSQGFGRYAEHHLHRTGEGGEPLPVCDDLLFCAGDHLLYYLHTDDQPSSFRPAARCLNDVWCE
jgi:flagellar protein FlaJ